MTTDTTTSRRTERRNRVFKGGRIVFHRGDSSIDCIIRDLSEAGAKLRVESIIGIPDEFELQSSDGHSWHCRVRWRKAAELGVQFTDA